MELVFRLTALQFSTQADFGHPVATVHVLPANADPRSNAYFEIRLPLTGVHRSSASPASALADAAVRVAQSLVLPSAAADFLQQQVALDAHNRALAAAADNALWSTPAPLP